MKRSSAGRTLGQTLRKTSGRRDEPEGTSENSSNGQEELTGSPSSWAAVKSAGARLGQTGSTSTNVIDIRLARQGGRCIEQVSVGGRTVLHARFPLTGRQDQLIDLSFLLALENLVSPISEGFLIWGATVDHKTRITRSGELMRGIGRFLSARHPNATLGELSNHWDEFYSWLASPEAKVRGTGTLTEVTQKALFNALKPLLNELTQSDVWRPDAVIALNNYPVNRYPDAIRFSQPRVRLSREVLERLDSAAWAEITEIAERMD